jgi:hypothetical protein
LAGTCRHLNWDYRSGHILEEDASAEASIPFAYSEYSPSRRQAQQQGVAILYKDQAVPRLTRTVIVFWNAGVALKGDDVRPEFPIGWAFSNSSSILEVRVLSTTREANHFEAYRNPVEPNVVLCKFDYLNRGDGASLEVLHTGDKRAPKPIGEVLNVSPALEYFGPIPSEAAAEMSPLRAYLYGLTLNTPLGLFRPFPPAIRRFRVWNSIFWRLAFLEAAVGLFIFASNTDAVFDFFCSPPSEGTTVEECRESMPAMRGLLITIGIIIIVILVSKVLRRSRRYPPILDPRDVL